MGKSSFAGLAAMGMAASMFMTASQASAHGGDERGKAERHNACMSRVPAAIGGPMLEKRHEAITLRWLGTSNYELVYKDQVFLLDTYYDRGPRNPSLGFTPDQVKRATAIMIGHGHFDHMSDAVPVAMQTGAPVIGAQVTIDAALDMGLPAAQARVAEDGDKFRFKGVTVDVVLARHSQLSSVVLADSQRLYDNAMPPATPEEAAAEAEIFERGTFDPRVATEGTLAFVFNFDTGYRLVWINSAGPVTESEEAYVERHGGVDVAIVAYAGNPIQEAQVPVTLNLVKLFKPKIYLPAHHDEIFGTFFNLGLQPLFERIQEELPGTQTLYPLYRQPICLGIENQEKEKTKKGKDRDDRD